jgi:parvulin-like peptidyl-prolyl isomerase
MKKLGSILVVIMLASTFLSACSVIQGLFNQKIVGDWSNDDAGTIHLNSHGMYTYYEKSGQFKIIKDGDETILHLEDGDGSIDFPMVITKDSLELTMFSHQFTFSRVSEDDDDVPVVAQVGFQVITRDAFFGRVTYERYQLVSTFVSYATSEYASMFQSQLIQVQNQLDDYLRFANDVLDKMIGEVALVQKAQSMGITVTDDEVEKEFHANLNYYPDGDAPENVTPVSEEKYNETYATVVANIEENTDFTEAYLREYIRTILYERKVFDQLKESVETKQEMVWARHILVADKETANEVLAKLRAGEDWVALAAEYSTDTSNSTSGGDLGWFTKGTMVKEFEDAAWALDVNEISDPVETDYGWHIIQLLGKETRELTADQLTSAQNIAYTKFIEDAKDELGVDTFKNWSKKVPSTPTVPDQYRITD